MENNWAAENLQTIRTLMERSALYRRALAPISTFVGIVGILAAIVGWLCKISVAGPFSLYWISIGVFALLGASFLVRRQAVNQGEQFWSPPMKRVTQAMMPAMLLGLLFGVLMMVIDWEDTDVTGTLFLIVGWTFLYGLALHAAGFFMARGIRLFSWGLLLAGIAMLAVFVAMGDTLSDWNKPPHWVMGIVFGASHLVYGVYLYLTEQRKNAA